MKGLAKTTKAAAKAKRQAQAEHSGGGAVHPLLHLQQAVGNRALSELLDGKVQRQGLEEEEPLQGKPDLQRQGGLEEEEPLQGKPDLQRQEGLEEEEPLQGKPDLQRQEEKDVLGNLAKGVGGSLKGILSALDKGKGKEKGKIEGELEIGTPGKVPPVPPEALAKDIKPGEEIKGKELPHWKSAKPGKPRPKLGKTNKLKFEEF